jgi:hypothetical protein
VLQADDADCEATSWCCIIGLCVGKGMKSQRDKWCCAVGVRKGTKIGSPSSNRTVAHLGIRNLIPRGTLRAAQNASELPKQL